MTVAKAPPPKSRSLDKQAIKVVLTLGAALLLGAFFMNLCSGPSEADKAHTEALEKAAIEAVKNDFEPKYEMLLLNPDTATGNWWTLLGTWGTYDCQGECVVVY